MKLFLNFLLFFTIFQVSSAQSRIFGVTEENNSTNPKYYARKVKDFKEFPYFVLLRPMTCGGSVISEHHVLTAAHCVDWKVLESLYDLTDVHFYVNTTSIKSLDPQNRISFTESNVLIHEEYVDGNFNSDIAIITVAEKIHAVPIKLAPKATPYNYLVYKAATIAGFGFIDVRKPSEVLNFAVLPVLKLEACMINTNKHAQNLCLGYVNGVSVCSGDSGSGLFIQINGEKRLIGTVSYGLDEFCTSGLPTVFKYVPFFIDWIEEKTGINFETNENEIDEKFGKIIGK